MRQVCYTLDLSQYAVTLGTLASEKDNFYHCINKALQKREPQLLGKLSGQVARVQSIAHAATRILEKTYCRHRAAAQGENVARLRGQI